MSRTVGAVKPVKVRLKWIKYIYYVEGSRTVENMPEIFEVSRVVKAGPEIGGRRQVGR